MAAEKQASAAQGKASLAQEHSHQMELQVADPLRDWGDQAVASTCGYRFVSERDRRDIQTQRQAIWDLLKSLGSHLLKDGVNLTRVSLPVSVFEPRSFLERIIDGWAYLDLLQLAADVADPVDRMKLLVAFVVGGLRRQTSTLKPFNPILGETFQADLAGTQVFVEQISHHPPISCWQVTRPDGKLHFSGSAKWEAAARGNSIRGQQAGTNTAWFASDGATVTWQLPQLLLKGILWGERILTYSGKVLFEDVQNELTCCVDLDAAKQPKGLIPAFWRSKRQTRPAHEVTGAVQQGDTVLDTCSGSWLTHLEWEQGVCTSTDGQRLCRVWDEAAAPVRQPAALNKPLPSDSRFREDLQALKRGDIDAAQQWKGTLETRQRSDDKLRQS